MELTKEDIEAINNECPSNQGIFNEPYGIPNNIKELVVYMRWETGGVSGGSCWDSSNPRPYTTDEPKPKFKALDLVLKRLKPDLTFLQFREIEELIKSSENTEWECYGNCTDWAVEFIVLRELIQKLEFL